MRSQIARPQARSSAFTRPAHPRTCAQPPSHNVFAETAPGPLPIAGIVVSSPANGCPLLRKSLLKMARKLFVLFNLVVMAALGFAFWHRFLADPVVTVRIKNATATLLTALTVIIRGKNSTIARLAPGKSKKVKIKPEGKSDLAISFVDATGKTNLANAEAYLGHGDHGEIKATIGLSNTVVWTGTEDLRAYY